MCHEFEIFLKNLVTTFFSESFREVSEYSREVSAYFREVSAYFREVIAYYREVIAYFREVRAYFRQVSGIIFGKLVHNFARKLVPRTSPNKFREFWGRYGKRGFTMILRKASRKTSRRSLWGFGRKLPEGRPRLVMGRRSHRARNLRKFKGMTK